MQKELSLAEIKQRIYTIRNNRVMLDTDLAEFYEVSTKRLNEQVKRNANRFPENFMFRLTQTEFENLRSQIVTSSSEYGGRRHLPCAFTEHGATMLAGVLKSNRAVQVNVAIVRTFVQLRETIAAQEDLAKRITVVEKQSDQILKTLVELNITISKTRSASTENRSILEKRSHSKIEKIQKAVTRYYGLKQQDLKSISRRQTIAFPRQIMMYLMRSNLGMSFSEIGMYFGGKNHTTILHAHQKIEACIAKQDHKICEDLEAIQRGL